MSLRSRAATLAVATILAGCAARPEPVGPIEGVSYRVGTACDAEAVTPQMIATSPAVLSPATWQRKGNWEAKIRFRVDETGTPTTIRTDVSSFEPDSDELERATGRAMSLYRFCRPATYDSRTEWSARMRFRYAPVPASSGSGAMYMQLFVPSYTRDEVRDGRTGSVVVRASFERDGRPATIRVATSSNDPVLDKKSLEAMASCQIAFEPGTVLSQPLEFEQRYTYEIR